MVLPPTIEFHEKVFEALPAPTFVLDEDLDILDFNVAAARLAEPLILGAEPHRLGEALECVYSAHSGCGNSSACAECTLRGSVRATLEQGLTTANRITRMRVKKGEAVVEAEFVLTSAAFQDGEECLALVLLQSVGELLALKINAVSA